MAPVVLRTLIFRFCSSACLLRCICICLQHICLLTALHLHLPAALSACLLRSVHLPAYCSRRRTHSMRFYHKSTTTLNRLHHKFISAAAFPENPGFPLWWGKCPSVGIFYDSVGRNHYFHTDSDLIFPSISVFSALVGRIT